MPSTGPELFGGIPALSGHFEFESGHHGDLWLDLDDLFGNPKATEIAAIKLAGLLKPVEIDVICGAMIGGALIGQVVARLLSCQFAYTERSMVGGLPRYTLPAGQHQIVARRRVALIDDVINAGSATSGTHHAIVNANGIPVAVAALPVLGNAIDRLATEWKLPVICNERRPSNLWHPDECPLCQTGIPLISPTKVKVPEPIR